jgi:hypothetical protein
MTDSPNPNPTAHGAFGSTHWTAVFAAAQTQSPAAEDALEELCRTYRYPLYAFARRKGLSHEDAEDLTQQFFAGRVVTRLVLQRLDPARGQVSHLAPEQFPELHAQRARQG